MTVAMPEQTTHGVSTKKYWEGTPFCLCGALMNWVDCWDCSGEGYHELYDLDPLWYDEDDVEMCHTCRGEGGFWRCGTLVDE